MPDNRSYNEKELLQLAAMGNQSAFRQIYDRYWEDLFQAAYKRTRSEDDARDIVQELFISFWNNIAHIKIEENIGGYLFVSLRNKIFNYLEKRSVRIQYLLQQPFQPVESEEAILSTIRSKEIKQCVAATVAAMPPRMKEIYLLSREQQLTVADIADLMGISPQTVKNQLHTALERIREELKQKKLFFFSIVLWL